MRLVRFGEKGKEKPGMQQQGKILDLTQLFPDIPDIGEKFFTDGWIEKIHSVSHSESFGKHSADKWLSTADVRIGCPVVNPSKIICLGKNYAEHAKEGGFEMPERPLLFCKTPNTLNGPYDPIILPQSSHMIDWEVELAVVIGKPCKRIKKEDAEAYIAGYTIMNDVSARQAQFSDSQWFRGKSFDTFAPLGPAIVTPDEISDIRNLRLETFVDSVTMQDGNTKDMIFDIPYLMEFISEDITLLPGDIISTGTPAGVGIFRKPPILLKPGNIVECRIEPIGSIINVVSEAS